MGMPFIPTLFRRGGIALDLDLVAVQVVSLADVPAQAHLAALLPDREGESLLRGKEFRRLQRKSRCQQPHRRREEPAHHPRLERVKSRHGEGPGLTLR